MLGACSGFGGDSADENRPRAGEYLRPSAGPSLPSKGFASLGRSIRGTAELAKWVHTFTHRCDAPVPVSPGRIAYVLPPGVQRHVTAAAVCQRGYGDVLVILALGSAREVQDRYRAALIANRTLWTRTDYTPLFGNSFFVVPRAWSLQLSYSTAGLYYLRCGADAGPKYRGHPADVAGCALSSEAVTP